MTEAIVKVKEAITAEEVEKKMRILKDQLNRDDF
jgi:hypothetical protein